MKNHYFLAALLLSFLSFSLALADQVIPPLRARVTDLTKTLSNEQKHSLDAELEALEKKDGTQLAVLIVPTTEPEAIEDYSIRVAEAWKLGQRDKNNGLLLLVAKNDRTVRIEVGYGLEGLIPDITAKRIIEDTIIPQFRSGNFFAGIQLGVARMISVLNGEKISDENLSGFENTPISNASLTPENNIPFVLILALVFGSFFRSVLGKAMAGLIGGLIGGIGIYFLIGSLLPALGLGLVVFCLILIGGSSGGRSGRSSGSSYSGGSSYRGGGGSFGGGGASGRW